MIGQSWIVTADNRKANAYSYQKSVQGLAHLQFLRSIEHEEAELEHERPSLMGGGGPARRGGAGVGSGSGMPHFGSGLDKRGADEEHHRFAKRVCEWIAEASLAERPEHVAVFVPVRMMAYLRTEFALGGKYTDLGKRVNVHDGELMRLSVNELAAHPKVAALHANGAHKVVL